MMSSGSYSSRKLLMVALWKLFPGSRECEGGGYGRGRKDCVRRREGDACTRGGAILQSEHESRIALISKWEYQALHCVGAWHLPSNNIVTT